MSIPGFVAWVFVGAVGLTGAAFGQGTPNRPVRIITSEVGSISDFASRLLAPDLSASLGQQFIVENRGGSAVVPGTLIAKASPDGSTLLLYGSTIWLLPFLQDNVPYDPVKDFSPITLVSVTPNILVAHPSLPVKSVKDLIALAKARPGELNYGSGTAGTSSHLAGELFKSMASITIVRVAYKGTGPAIVDLIGGQLQLMFPNAGGVMPHIRSGRLKALAVTSGRPSELLPDLPTVAATGVPGYKAVTISSAFAPAKTPEAVINRLNQEFVRVLNRADTKKKFLNVGAEVAGGSPAQLAATMGSDMQKMGKVIKDSGIRAE